MSQRFKKVMLGDIATISSGGTPSRSKSEYWEGDIPWISASTMHQSMVSKSSANITKAGLKAGSKLAEKGNLLLLVRGSMLWKKVPICMCLRDVAFNQDVKSLNVSEKVDAFYLLYWFLGYQKFLLNKVVGTGIGAGKIDTDELKALDVALPPLPEQKAIADVLATWDQAIEKTEQLIKAKENELKHLYRALFQVPVIEKKWKIKKLGDIFVQISDKVGDKDLVPHSISSGLGFVSQKEKWGKDISGKQYKNYTHLKAGQISYNKGNSKRYKQGCAYLLRDGEICVPNVFISFKPSSSDVNVVFYEHYFIADYHSRELRKFISSGARSDGLLNLNKKDFFKMKVPHPTLKQQNEVAECLTTAEKEITILKKLLTQYQTQKRGLMQRLLTGEWRVKF